MIHFIHYQKPDHIRNTKIKKPSVHFITKKYLFIETYIHFLSKDTFYDKMDLQIFYFHVTKRKNLLTVEKHI